MSSTYSLRAALTGLLALFAISALADGLAVGSILRLITSRARMLVA